MSNLSLQKSIQGCKVTTGWAPRQQSDRFLNSNNLSCPLWNGLDLTGRPVCPDSFMTKTEGCSNPLDRVMVENDQRPKYFEYLTLNAAGLDVGGDQEEVINRAIMLNNAARNTPAWGQDLNASIGYGGCAVNSYEKAMSGSAEAYRSQQMLNNAYAAARTRRFSGM